MSQTEILKILEKKGRLFATQIIEELRIDDEPKQFIRRVLKQMRKYGEVGFIQVWACDENGCFKVEFCDKVGVKKFIREEMMYKKFPELKDKKITRSCYLYFSK